MHVTIQGDEDADDTKERDVYDTMLTRTQIQDGVDSVNTTVKREEAEAKSKILTCFAILRINVLLFPLHA